MNISELRKRMVSHNVSPDGRAIVELTAAELGQLLDLAELTDCATCFYIDNAVVELVERVKGEPAEWCVGHMMMPYDDEWFKTRDEAVAFARKHREPTNA